MRLSPLVLMLCASVVAAAPLRAEPVVPSSKAEISFTFAPVVKAATPSVVNIYAQRIVSRYNTPFAGDPFFDRLFRDFGTARPEVQNSLGSGVIVSADGLVVSNYHVVGAATEITVVLADKREFDAEVVLSDQDNDLAVLKLKGAEGLPALPLRDSDTLEVGDLVLAIGNPFGLGQTVSMGIISALARSLQAVGDGHGYFLQTDAAINPGNSGGALVDASGKLVGINTAIFTQGGGSNGVGFAIPSNLVAAVVAQAETGASAFSRPWAGVSGQAVDGNIASGLGLDRPEGVILSDVHPQSPFALAGLRAGDVVLRLGGSAVNSPQEMIFRMSALGIGTEVSVDYMREGEPRGADVTLLAAPDDPPRDERVIRAGSPFEGMTVGRINPSVIAEYDLPIQAEGVIVTALEGWSRRTGLRPGDVLVALNGRKLAEPDDVERALKPDARDWVVEWLRDGKLQRARFRR